ncbi:MAG: ParB/RepB/Spo0J family partition protein [Acidimicrobiales bacterium]
MRRGGLGKGLGSLIPTGLSEGALARLPVGSVHANPHQPRRHFDEADLASLAASIVEVGVLQPIVVRPIGDGEYELVAGERRLRASKRAGLDLIPAVVRETSDRASLQQALIENIHRADLSPLEEAAGFQQLLEDFGFTHEELGDRVGKSRAYVTNTLRLMQLPPSVQRLLSERRITAGHARALLGTPDRAYQEVLARRAASEPLSVRQIEDAVRARQNGEHHMGSREAGTRSASLRPPGLLELEELLALRLDTRVTVEMGAKRGRVVVEFASVEDLERIYRAMVDTGPTGGVGQPSHEDLANGPGSP